MQYLVQPQAIIHFSCTFRGLCIKCGVWTSSTYHIGCVCLSGHTKQIVVIVIVVVIVVIVIIVIVNEITTLYFLDHMDISLLAVEKCQYV